MKPIPWALRRAFTYRRWDWFWRHAHAVYPLWEGRGGRTVNVVTGGYLVPVSVGGQLPFWTSGVKGVATQTDRDAASGYWGADNDPIAQRDDYGPAQLTLLGYGHMAWGGDSRIIARCDPTLSGSQDHDWMLSETLDGAMRMRVRGGGGVTAEVNGTDNFADGTLGLWGGVYDGANIRLWVNTYWDPSTTGKTGDVNPVAGRKISVLNRISDGTAGWDQPLYWTGVFGKAFTREQLLQLSSDPFGPFRPSRIVGQRFQRWRDLPAQYRRSTRRIPG